MPVEWLSDLKNRSATSHKSRPAAAGSSLVGRLDAGSIRVTDPGGRTQDVAKAELSGIAVETDDSGHMKPIRWLLFGATDQPQCVMPQGATGEGALIAYVVTLPWSVMPRTAAMRSTDKAVFAAWPRAAEIDGIRANSAWPTDRACDCGG